MDFMHVAVYTSSFAAETNIAMPEDPEKVEFSAVAAESMTPDAALDSPSHAERPSFEPRRPTEVVGRSSTQNNKITCVCNETCSRCWQCTPIFQLTCCLAPCLLCCQGLSDDNGKYCCFEDTGDEVYYTYTGIRTCL